jgi:hypothetical protein
VIVENFLAAAVDHTKVLSKISVSLCGNLAGLEQLRRARPMMDIMAINTNDLDSQKHRGFGEVHVKSGTNKGTAR